MQNRFLVSLIYATRTGICPVCHRRPRARWKDTGSLRMTCGDPLCFLKWLPGSKSTLDKFDALNELPALEEVLIDG